MAPGLRIFLRDQQFFDLREVMEAVGDLSDLDWSLHHAYFNGDVTPVWPDGADSAEERSKQGGIQMDWEQMASLAAHCRQIIDGRFIGCASSGLPVVVLSVVDSSFWEVRSSLHGVIAQTRRRFPDAEGLPDAPLG